MSKLMLSLLFIAMNFGGSVGARIGDENKTEQIMETLRKSGDISANKRKPTDTFQNEGETPPLSGFDIPLDAFSLHHPYLKTHLVEYEFSAWYFLFFTIFYQNQNTTAETKTVDVSLLVPELNEALASKLSVPAAVIKIAKAEKYRSNSISANISLTNHTIPRLHQQLSNLNNISPLFWLGGIRYKLVQVIHDKNQHLFVKDKKYYTDNEVGLLVIVTLGGIIIFLVLVMLALLNVRLCCQEDQSGDMNSLLQESLNSPIFTLDREFKAETEQFMQEVYNDSDHESSEARLDIEDIEEKSSSENFRRNIFNKFKYTKRFFN